MIQLILKNSIENNKLEALLLFLKTWGIEAELKNANIVPTKKKSDFNLSFGLWSDYAINADELRKQSWSRK